MNPFGKGNDEGDSVVAPTLMPSDNAPSEPAFQEDTGAHDGELHNQLKSEGVIDQPYTDEQASKEAEAAVSESNAKKAAKKSRVPHLLVGARVSVSPDAEAHANRVGRIERIEWASQNDEVLAGLGTPESRFAKASGYHVRFRDGVGGVAEIPAAAINSLADTNFRRGLT